ncbi:MAG: zinc-ribbon domain-containing protein [Burkholderiaceae bacterium]|nr:zinc-ribbon domain-containing protein [Burkholderiaceae bacterium]
MALATTCPQCKTSFKVVPDQLKLRRGLVRCGACQHVFSGIDFLRYVDESKPARHAASAATTRPADDALQTAFFLPETILATPPAASPAGMQPPVSEPDAQSPGPASDDTVAAETRAEDAVADEAAPAEAAPPDEAAPDEAAGYEAPPDVAADESATSRTPATGMGMGESITPVDALHGLAEREVDAAIGLAEANAEGIAEDIDDEASEGNGEGRVGGADTDAAIPATGAPDPWRTGDHAIDEIVAWTTQTVEPADIEEAQVESLTATTPPGFPEIDAEDRIGRDGIRFGAHDEIRHGAAGDVGDGLHSDLRSTIFDETRPQEARDGRQPAVPDHDRDRFGPGASRLAAPAVAAVATGPGEEEDESAIDYFSSARRGIGFIDRHGPFALAGVLLLALLLGAQWTIGQRSMIAARVPALAPALSSILAPFGLDIGLPRDLGSLTIESFELQASAAPGVLAMSALLRNRADYAVSWPSMQLTLTDAGNRVLVRKVLGPDDYLRESHGGEGLPPRAEWPLRLALEADDLQPAGYSVVLFYP